MHRDIVNGHRTKALNELAGTVANQFPCLSRGHLLILRKATIN